MSIQAPISDFQIPAEADNGVVVKAEKLSKRFNREWIFKDLDYTFEPGCTIAVTGPNGSGKSTLVQVLCGHLPPSSGSLKYLDHQQVVPDDEIFRRISIAAPYMDLIEEFTLTELLKFHFSLRQIRNNIEINELIEIMYLEKSADKQIANFSSGMKQRLKLGMALYTSAPVVFLDEPGTNLDKNAFDWYLKELRKLPASCITLIASNDPEEYPTATDKLDISAFKK